MWVLFITFGLFHPTDDSHQNDDTPGANAPISSLIDTSKCNDDVASFSRNPFAIRQGSFRHRTTTYTICNLLPSSQITPLLPKNMIRRAIHCVEHSFHAVTNIYLQ